MASSWRTKGAREIREETLEKGEALAAEPRKKDLKREALVEQIETSRAYQESSKVQVELMKRMMDLMEKVID